MKNIKKLLSIVMVLTLVLALGASAFADAAPNVTVEKTPGHEYKAYQIFSGDNQAADEGAIGNLTWGGGIDAKAFAQALVDAKLISVEPDAAGNYDAQEVAKALSEMTDDSDALKEVARIAAANVIPGEAITVTDGATVGIGYYVIVDVTSVEGEDAVQNEVVLQVTQNVNVTFKSDKPSSDKQVKDVNDSTGEAPDWQKTADHDINDTINYRLHAKLPADVSAYETYYLQFVDTLSVGLTYATTGKITIGGEEYELSSFTVDGPSNVTEGEYAGGTQVTWTCDDLIARVEAKGKTAAALNGADVYIEYTATLNEEHAVIGPDGNPNEMHIVYSNTPDGKGHGATPDDKVTVFTFQLDVKKVTMDAEGNEIPLAGAGFTLSKWIKDSSAEGGHWEEIGDQVMVSGNKDDGYVANFKGLDDGQYKIVETTTPAGYNTIPDVTFTVTAGHVDETLSLDKFDVSDVNPTTFTVTATLADGHLSTTIVNESGLELPETGGIGTTIFYVVGGVLVAGAVILLVTKKRVNGAK